MWRTFGNICRCKTLCLVLQICVLLDRNLLLSPKWFGIPADIFLPLDSIAPSRGDNYLKTQRYWHGWARAEKGILLFNHRDWWQPAVRRHKMCVGHMLLLWEQWWKSERWKQKQNNRCIHRLSPARWGKKKKEHFPEEGNHFSLLSFWKRKS